MLDGKFFAPKEIQAGRSYVMMVFQGKLKGRNILADEGLDGREALDETKHTCLRFDKDLQLCDEV